MVESSKSKTVLSDHRTHSKIGQLSYAFSRSSAICFAIFDQDLRFRAANKALAETHGASIEEHMGTSIGDIIGELAVQARPALQRVLRNKEELCFENQGRLPNGPSIRGWVNHLFPVETARRKVKQVGVLAVEVTEMTRFDLLYTNLPTQFHGIDENAAACIRDLHNCIREYKTTLGLNLASLCNSPGDPEKALGLFTHSIHLLDQRMAELISAATYFFPD